MLNACERCGRWLLPDTLACPDPHCAARVLPLLAQHTGRRRDARGSGVGWTWPVRWDRAHPEHGPPVAENLAAAETLHAAFVAHGRLYLWEGTNLLSPDEDTAWNAAAERGIAWRCPLGPAGVPAERLAPAERVAVAGARAVLALQRGYLALDLRQSSDSVSLGSGTPLAQAGGPGWWIAWLGSPAGAGEPSGRSTLRLAGIGEMGDVLEPERIEVPPEGALASRGRIALRDGRAYWPGLDGGIWRLDCVSRGVERVVEGGEGVPVIWAEPNGPRAARETRSRITVGLTPPAEGRFAVNAPAGMPPLRGVFALPGHVVVLGDRLAAFDTQTGDRFPEAMAPPGTWIDGALVPAEDGEPRFLALTQEGRFSVLSALRMSSGAHESVWREPDLEPRALLPVGTDLYIAHSRGIVRLREAQL